MKAQLEQEVTVDKDEEQELADLEESLAGSGDGAGSGAGSGVGRTHGGTLDTMSLTSDETPGAQVVWAGGACGGLVYESVDELRVAVESLQVRQHIDEYVTVATIEISAVTGNGIYVLRSLQVL